MEKRGLAALVLIAALLGAARAQGADGSEATAAAGGQVAAPEGDEEGDGEKKDYVFVTGLDFSYWVADQGPTVWGPGLSLGFVLVPRHLEMALAVGAMLGGHQYTIPVELSFTVPIPVNEWFAPFLRIGPTVLTDKVQGDTTYDFAAAFGAGLEFLPVGFDWSVFASGDYSVRTLQDVRHQGGFTLGFRYRV